MIEINFPYKREPNSLIFPYPFLPEKIDFLYRKNISFHLLIENFLFEWSMIPKGICMRLISDAYSFEKSFASFESFAMPDGIAMTLSVGEVSFLSTGSVLSLKFRNLGVGIRTLEDMSSYTLQELKDIPLGLLFSSVSSWLRMSESEASLQSEITIRICGNIFVLRNEIDSIARNIYAGQLGSASGLSDLRSVRGMTLGELAPYTLGELWNLPISFWVYEDISAQLVRHMNPICHGQTLSCGTITLRME